MPKPASDKSSAGICSHPGCISDRRRTVLRIFLAAFAVLILFSLAAASAGALITSINNVNDLEKFRDSVNVGDDYGGVTVYLNAADLDLSSVCGPDVEGSEISWTPIGTYSDDNSKAFKGTFDGQGHTISGLYISRTGTDGSADFQGLFGYIQGTSATIKNLGVTGAVTGNNNVGGLVGRNNGGTIENCYATVTVTGSYYVGGLVGKNEGTTASITNCYATGTVTGKQNVGGLVGDNSGGTIRNCYATGAVTGTGNHVGGLVGSNRGTIENCYATVTVTGSYYVGGLVGKSSGTITYCYATGAVTGSYYVGGLVGENGSSATITKSIALNPSVSGSNYVGRVVGQNNGGGDAITNCYAWKDMIISASATGYAGTPASSSEIWNIAVTQGVWDLAWFDTTGKWGLNLDSNSKPNNEYYQLPVLKDSVGNLRADTVSDAAHLSIIGGDGSAANAYKISGPAQLHGLALLVNAGNIHYNGNKFYIVTAEIDLSGVCGPNVGDDGTSWTPIGKYSATSSENKPFSGKFDGNGKTISGLYINDDESDFQGLFGYTGDGAEIKDLGLTSVRVTGKQNVGGLVGQNYKGKIENCYATGTVTGNISVGGLMGWNNGGRIENCYATGTVTGTGEDSKYIGGLAGGNEGGTDYSITNCYATGTVTGSDSVGGLAGWNKGSSTSIKNSVALNPYVSATGTTPKVGRVVGEGSCDTNCYAWGGMTKGPSSTSLYLNGGNNGADATSAQVWANITFYETTLGWGNSISTEDNDKTWKITSNSEDGWGIPYLRSLGAAPSDTQSIQHLKQNIVTYDGNGNTDGTVPVDPKRYTKNKDTVTVLGNTGSLQKTGYTFAGWKSEAGINYIEGATFTIKSDTTLKANWTANTYNVTYNGNGNTSGSTATSTHTYDVEQALTANGFTKTGYNFVGWATTATGEKVYSDKQNVKNLANTQGATVTLYAKWEPAPEPSHTVTPTPNPSSGGSTDTGSGHFTDYPRIVPDGGHVSFGTSPIVTGVDMPEGVTGNVELITVVVTDTDGREFYATFEINAPESADGERSLIYFQLDLQKIEADGYTVKDVVLSHKNEDGTWTDLKTTYLGTEDGKAKYSAENTVGYSVFAIYYTKGASIEDTEPAVTAVVPTAEPEPTYVEPVYVEPTKTATAVPTTEQTKSPVGLVGLGLGLLGAFAALRRK